MSFASQFKAGSDIAADLIDTYYSAKKRRELEDIANEKPQESTGFTADQGDQIRRAAESGQYDIGYDEAAKAYTVTPKADPSQVGRIQQQGVTDFMGQRTAGTMNEGQINNARQRAMAGVLMKSDPVQGMRMMRDVTQGERDDQRFDWEKRRSEREDRTASQKEADDNLMRQVDSEVGDWFKTKLTNPDGSQRAATVDDHLAASQFRAAKLMDAGKADAAGQVIKEYNAGSLAKIHLETAQRDQALGKTASALAAGDLNAVKDFYNQFIPDGARVTDVKQGPKGEIIIQRESLDGRPMPPNTLKDTGQLLSALSSFKDPMALYNWSQNEFKNNLALKADARADRGETRADKTLALHQATAGVSMAHTQAQTGILQQQLAEKKELDAVRTGLLQAIENKDEEGIAKGRSQMMSYMISGKSGTQNMAPEERKANFYLASGMAKTPADAARMAHEKVQSSPKDDYMALMKPNSMGMMPKVEEVEPIMEAMHGANWKQKLDGTPKSAMASDPKAIAIRDDKTLSIEQKRAKLKELGYQ